MTIQSAPSFASIWIMPRLPAFLRAHPEIDVRLWAVHQAPDFSNSGVDVAVMYGRPTASAGVHVEPVSARERYLPVCSPKLVDGWTLPLPASDIENFYLIQNDVSLTSWDEWIARYAPECRSPAHGLRLDRAFMTLSAAENENKRGNLSGRRNQFMSHTDASRNGSCPAGDRANRCDRGPIYVAMAVMPEHPRNATTYKPRTLPYLASLRKPVRFRRAVRMLNHTGRPAAELEEKIRYVLAKGT